jgi:hypothetical protein
MVLGSLYKECCPNFRIVWSKHLTSGILELVFGAKEIKLEQEGMTIFVSCTWAPIANNGSASRFHLQ